jgi:quinol monooxygenase YgiN
LPAAAASRLREALSFSAASAWQATDESQHQRSKQIIDTLRCEAYVSNMKSKFVSLHPYFKVHPGKLETVKAGFPRFVEKTAAERKNLFYGFSINGDEIFCREGYIDADGVLAHLDNVGVLLAEMLKIADLTRVEVHGPAEELDKLRGPLAHPNPAWFTVEWERK